MALPFLDPFTGSAGVLANPPWFSLANGGTTVTMNLDGAGNAKASATDTSNDICVYDVSNSYANNQYAQIKITNGIFSGSNYVDISVRVSGSNTTAKAYHLFTDGASGAGHTGVEITWNGASVVLVDIAATFALNDIMRIEILGSVITSYKNGSVINTYDTVSDTNKILTGSAGFGVYNAGVNGVTVDNFEGGNLGGLGIDDETLLFNMITIRDDSIVSVWG